MTEVIIIGSGPGGVSAAWPLVEAGRRVLMLDYGLEDHIYKPLVPRRSFEFLRAHDRQQHRYFLGREFEGVLMGDIRVGTKLTPPRLHVLARAEDLAPVMSENFAANQSLALGGLGAAWGATAMPFTPSDLVGMPVTRRELEPHYRAVAERIGVSGADDDLTALFGDVGLQPPVDLDSNAASLLARYQARRAGYAARGFRLGRAHLAVLTRALAGRSPHTYHDMEYWTDTDDSVYRPAYTLDRLRRRPNFSYLSGRLARAFRETEDGVIVSAQGPQGPEEHRAKALVLAAGTMGSARLVLASQDRYHTPLPILTNPYTYVPSLNLNMLGVRPRDRRCSLAQLSAVYQPHDQGPSLQSCFFSYRSLLTFKLLKEAPLAQRELLAVMRALMPLFAIVTFFHADRPSPYKYCLLRPGRGGEPDRMEIVYQQTRQEQRAIRRMESQALGFYRRLGCLPLKAIRRAPGSSIHYAGTLPLSDTDRPLTCDRWGRLHGARRVHVADGSLISPLPSTVLTLTIMALADRVGRRLSRELDS